MSQSGQPTLAESIRAAAGYMISAPGGKTPRRGLSRRDASEKLSWKERREADRAAPEHRVKRGKK